MFPVRCFAALGGLGHAAVGCRIQSVRCFTTLDGLSRAYRLLWRKKPKRPARKVGRGAGLKGRRAGKHAGCAAKWGSSKGSFPSVGARIRRFSVA